MRYSELLYEATQQFWDHTFIRFLDLRRDVTTDPQGVIAECEALIRTFNAITPADVGEEELIEIAVECCDDLIEEAERIINQQP